MLTFMKKTILILHKGVFDLIKINSQLNQLKKHLLIIKKNTFTCVTGRIRFDIHKACVQK